MATTTEFKLTAATQAQPKVKLLLVDDSPENLVSLEAILEGLGQELVFAGSGTEALRRLLEDDLAAILLDVKMPGADGLAAARAIRDLGPVVHLGAHDMLAVSRYAEVRGVLGDPATYCSGAGVGLNEVVNGLFKGNTLMSDGELHRTQREVVGRPGAGA